MPYLLISGQQAIVGKVLGGPLGDFKLVRCRMHRCTQQQCLAASSGRTSDRPSVLALFLDGAVLTGPKTGTELRMGVRETDVGLSQVRGHRS